MKKILELALAGIMCVSLAGCMAAGADGQDIPLLSVDKSISLKEGYYTNENDDSYIHIVGNKIELCGADAEADAQEAWEQLMADMNTDEREKQKSNYESFIKNSVEEAQKTYALQEFTPVTFSLPDGYRSTCLALNYVEGDKTVAGYSLKSEDTILMGETYCYYGTELPQ